MSIIEVNNLYKHFKVYLDKGKTLKERVLFSRRRKFENREVLRGVNLRIEKGESVGLIGHNGSGKSTLLKVLSRILYPDNGSVFIDGRVSSLLELGAGFHPDLSGRENIYANAAVFGLKRKEVDRRIQSIIEFSELEEYLDNPVRTYSSGMYMRLAFSVAINVDADVLLIDEILAVGDASFQEKCMTRMKQLKEEGVTIVLVSHMPAVVEDFCTRAVWLNNGVIEADGEPKKVCGQYLDFLKHKQEAREKMLIEKELQRKSRMTEEEIAAEAPKEKREKTKLIKSVEILDAEGKKTRRIKRGDDITVKIDYEKTAGEDIYNFAVGVYMESGLSVYATNMFMDKVNLEESSKKDGPVKFHINDFPLLGGKYFISVAVQGRSGEAMDIYDNLHFSVDTAENALGICEMAHDWEV